MIIKKMNWVEESMLWGTIHLIFLVANLEHYNWIL